MRKRTDPGATSGALPARPEGLRATRASIGDLECVVFSYPVDSELGELTPAESEVARLLVRGLTNAAIATTRGSTLRTVSKQVDAIYRKLGVHSRVELALKVAGST